MKEYPRLSYERPTRTRPAIKNSCSLGDSSERIAGRGRAAQASHPGRLLQVLLFLNVTAVLKCTSREAKSALGVRLSNRLDN